MRRSGKWIWLLSVAVLCCSTLEAAPPWQRAYRAHRDMVRANLEHQQASGMYPRQVYQQQKRLLRQDEKYLRQAYRSTYGQPGCYYLPGTLNANYYTTSPDARQRVVVAAARVSTQPVQVSPAMVYNSAQVPSAPARHAQPIRQHASAAHRAQPPVRPSMVKSAPITGDLFSTQVVEAITAAPAVVSTNADAAPAATVELLPELVPTPVETRQPTTVVPVSDDGPQPTPAKRPADGV